MKKKILSVLLMTIMFFGLTGCGGNSADKDKLTYKDDSLKLTSEFEYNKDDGFEFVKNVPDGRFAEIEFRNKKENLYFDMYYTETSKEQIEILKNDRKEKKYFKEYKFDKYDAYVYSDFESNLYLIVDLKENKDTNSLIELFVGIELEEFDKDAVVFDIFNKDIIYNFFSSIKITED